MTTTRIKNDVNGNPRRVCHFLSFLTDQDKAEAPEGLDRIHWLYGRALARAKRIGGRRFHNYQFGGGIVFQCYSDKEMEENIRLAKEVKL